MNPILPIRRIRRGAKTMQNVTTLQNSDIATQRRTVIASIDDDTVTREKKERAMMMKIVNDATEEIETTVSATALV